jgi:hypothetical protein
MDEDLSALLLVIFGVVSIAYSIKNDEKTQIRVNDKPVNIVIGGQTVNLSQILMFCVGMLLVAGGISFVL